MVDVSNSVRCAEALDREDADSQPCDSAPVRRLRTLIASNSQSIAVSLAERLCRLGQDCDPSSALSIPAAIESLAHASSDVDMVFFVLNGDMDASLSDLQRLQSQTSAKIVAVGASDDPKQVLRVIRAGASDVISDGANGDESELTDLFQRFTTDRRADDRRGAAVLVSSPCGGVGKSVLCANLSVTLAEKRHTCGLLDLHVCEGDLAALLNVKPRHSVNDLLHLRESLDLSMFEQSLTDHSSKVRLLASPATLSIDSRSLASELVRIIELSKSVFEFSLVDVDNTTLIEQPDCLKAFDQILVVTRLDFLALVRTRRHLTFLEQCGIPQDKVRLVANRHGQPREVPLDKAQEALRTRINYFVPDDPRTVNASVNVGVPFVIEAAATKTAGMVKLIAKDIVGGAEPSSDNGDATKGAKARIGEILSLIGVS